MRTTFLRSVTLTLLMAGFILGLFTSCSKNIDPQTELHRYAIYLEKIDGDEPVAGLYDTIEHQLWHVQFSSKNGRLLITPVNRLSDSPVENQFTAGTSSIWYLLDSNFDRHLLHRNERLYPPGRDPIHVEKIYLLEPKGPDGITATPIP